MHAAIRMTILAVAIVFSIAAASAQTASVAIGDTIRLSGSAPGADSVFLFLTGPNLPVNGVKLDDISVPVITGDPNTFVVVTVTGEGSWEYAWDTATMGGVPDAGMYEVYAVTSPTGRKDLSASDSYAIIVVSLIRPTITARTGGLLINSQPPGAGVRVDGSLAGTTPLDLSNVSPGDHSLEVSKPGFEPATGNVRVVGGENTTVNWTLETEITQIVSSPPSSPLPGSLPATRAAGYGAVFLFPVILIVVTALRKA